MVASKKKEVKISCCSNPQDRVPRAKSDPGSNRGEKPAWSLRLADPGGPWSFRNLNCKSWWDDVYVKLCHFETMTWQEILSASGGRSKGNNNHEIPINELNPKARKRLKDLKMNDLSHLFSLRLTGEIRIWGILDGFVLKVLWYDTKHQVCPSLR